MKKKPSWSSSMAAKVLSAYEKTIVAKAPVVTVKYCPKPGTSQVQPFLTPKQLAALLQINVKTLERMKAEGKGPLCFSNIGNRVRYFIDDVVAWLDQNKTPQSPTDEG